MSPRIIAEDDLPVVYDTREQLPYLYPGARRVTLPTGDYSIAGFESRVAIERKSFSDLVGCCGAGRARFEKQFARLGSLDYGALVIEATVSRIREGHEISRISPASILNTLFSWSTRYGVYVWHAADREEGAAITYRLLQHWHRANVEVPDTTCRRCGRPLTAHVSATRGIGPTCHDIEISQGVIDSMESPA